MTATPNNGLEGVIAKVRKLMAFAADGRGNEAEMNNAAAMAEKIMTEYNLSVASIEAADGRTDGSREKAFREERAQYKWKQDLMAAIAALNFCYVAKKSIWENGKTVFKGYNLVGRKVNVASAQVMYDYLSKTIDRIVKDTLVDYRLCQSQKANSMRQGMTDSLVIRLQNKRDEEVRASRARAEANKATGAGANALVVVLADYVQDEADLNQDFRNGWEPGTTRRQREKANAAQAERSAKVKAYQDQGFDFDVAWDLAYGYSVEEALKRNKPKTAKQQAKDDAKWQRYRRQQERAREREAAKYDAAAYNHGREIGETISLNEQLDRKTQRAIG